MLATPIQLAVLAARIANGGVAVKPRIVRPAVLGNAAVDEEAGLNFESLNIPLPHLEILRQGMHDVVNGPPGTTTAMSARLKFTEPEMKGWTLSGKTGTAAVRGMTAADREAQKRDPSSVPWHLRDNALFIAFAPSHAPRYAMAVVVDHALGGGGAFAAPIAKDIMEMVLRLDPSRKPRTEDQIAQADVPHSAIDPADIAAADTAGRGPAQ